MTISHLTGKQYDGLQAITCRNNICNIQISTLKIQDNWNVRFMIEYYNCNFKKIEDVRPSNLNCDYIIMINTCTQIIMQICTLHVVNM